MKINNIMQLRKLFALSSVASAMILTGCGGGEDDKKTSTPDTLAVISIDNTSIPPAEVFSLLNPGENNS